MKTLLKLLIPLLILSGCGLGEKYCTRYYPPMQIDTSWTDTVINNYHDTVMVVEPPDYGLIDALVECDSLGRVYIKQIETYKAGIRVKPGLSFVNNHMIVECKVDSLKVFAIVYNKVIKIKNVKAKNSTRDVNILTWWQKTQIIGFWIFFGVVVVFLGTKLLSMKTNILKSFIK